MKVTIEKMVYGGAGLARTPDGVVFVPRSAPGDVLDVEVFDRKKDYASARIVSILEPSPDRQLPTCPNYDSVGCCHWQHLRYERQLEIKETVLRETLQRTGHIDWNKPIRILQGPDHHYRLRATFHVRDMRLGFIKERSNVVVPIRECDSLAPELNAFIADGNQLLRGFGTVQEVHAVCGPPTVASFDGIRTGEANPRIHVNNVVFEMHPDAFFQSNRYLLDAFMTEVLNLVGPEAGYVLDLYCGSGFFSIPIAQRAKEVLGVESSRLAVRQGKLNAKLNAVSNASFVERDVEAAMKEAEVKPDVVLLNPPRTGCGNETAARIAKLGAPKVVYVSCNPSTFGRESAVFLEQGYELERLTMIDQFPNTYHIELVAGFTRKD